LGQLTTIEQLELSYNDLDGTLPPEICTLTSLVTLTLDNNMLSGSLPECIASSLSSAQSIILHNNDFRGHLPANWHLPSLMSIVLSNNPSLHGTLPASLFTQRASPTTPTPSHNRLRAVVLEGTSIHGTLPQDICECSHLQTLALSGNKLSGSLPACIFTLQRLRTIRMANNIISGEKIKTSLLLTLL